MDCVTDSDRDDLARAKALLIEGKKLRDRVMARIRKRKWRANQLKKGP